MFSRLKHRKMTSYIVQNTRAKKSGILSLANSAKEQGVTYRCTKRVATRPSRLGTHKITQPAPVVVLAGQTFDHLFGRNPAISRGGVPSRKDFRTSWIARMAAMKGK
jgi:hypothetical protein